MERDSQTTGRVGPIYREVSRIRDWMGGRLFYGWWIVIVGALLAGLGQGILYYSFTVFFLPLKRDFVVSTAAVAFLFGAGRLEGGVEGPLVGYLIDRFGPRALIILGASLAGVGLLLISTVNSFVAFAFIYILLIAFGYNAGFFHPLYAAINSWFVRRRGVAFAIITSAGGAGGMIMAPLLSKIILNYGWRMGTITAGLIILAVVPAALVVSRSPESRGLLPDGGPVEENHSEGFRPVTPSTPEVDLTVREALRTLRYWLLCVSLSLRVPVSVAIAAHLIPIFVWKGISEATGAYLVSLFTFSTIITTLAMGWIGDRWNKASLSSLGILPTVFGMLGLVVIQGKAILYAFPVFLAILMGTTPLNWSLLGDLFGRRKFASLRGTMAISYGTVTFIAPIYAGWIFDRTGSYTTVLLSFSFFLLIAAFLFFILRRYVPTRS